MLLLKSHTHTVTVALLSGQGDDENALVDNEEAQAEEVLH